MERMMSAPPTHIIHLAALSSPERCEEDPAQAVSSNVAMTETIASYADRVGAHLITASTDLVFDGLARGVPGGIPEEIPPCPVSVYAKTKRRAEELTLATKRGTVARLSLLYGSSPARSAGTTAWMERNFHEKVPVRLFHDEFRSPIHVADAARLVCEIARRDLLGVWHCGGPERLSLVVFGTQIAHTCGFTDALIQRVSMLSPPTPPKRPEDVSLDSRRLWKATGITPRTVSEAFSAEPLTRCRD
jgi:dTDP-4-dehydrorhamnose reductase